MRNKLYAERDIEGLDEDGSFYFNHVLAMTAENLQSKSAIAAELGYRDSVIVELQARLEHAIGHRDTLKQQNAELAAQVEALRKSIYKAYNYQLNVSYDNKQSVAAIFELLGEAFCLAKETPTQCLLEVKADAGRDGYQQGIHEWRVAEMNYESFCIQSKSIEYANKIRGGE